MVAIFLQTEQQSSKIQDAIALLESLGFCPLPVVPLQSAEKWFKRDRLGQVVKDSGGNPKPLFNGKCPSYFDSEGKPRLIKNWAEAAEADPTWGDLSQYNAIGVANNRPGKRWIDLDRKHFPSTEEFDQTVARLKAHAIVSEFSPAGWHGLIGFEVDPLEGKNQRNISIDGIGHVGEIPGFIVTSPSRRADGSSYQLDFVNMNAPEVINLESLGLSPSAAEASQPAAAVEQPQPAPAPARLKLVHSPGAAVVELEMLISKKCLSILKGDIEGDRSKALATFARECWGWENLASAEGFQVSSADDLINAAAAALEISDKRDRVLKGIDPANCKPGLEFGQGRNKAIAKLKRLANCDAEEVEQFQQKQKLRKLDSKELLNFLRENYTIELDAWSQEILLDGELLEEIEDFYLELAETHNLSVSKTLAMDALLRVAKQNKRDKVLDYLNHCRHNVDPLPKEYFDLIANFCFGTAEEFDNLALKKSLIAAVARAYEPGCKVDECPVLQGPQATGKSSFLRILAGDDYFNDNIDLSKGIDKDERAKLQGSWLHEIAELDKITSKREASELKAFITERVDNYRVPYSKRPKQFARRCMLFATVNPPQFLVDPTGNRRYPIIKIKKRIDFEKIEKHRDAIWAAAVQAYFAGESWHYNAEETGMINRRADEFAFEDPWDSAVMDYLETRDITTISSVLKHALDIEISKQGTKEMGRLGKILTRLGWVKGERRRLDGKLCNPWYPPASPLQLELESCDSVEYLTNILKRHNQYEIDKAFDRLSEGQKAKYQRLESKLKEQIGTATVASQPTSNVEQPTAAADTSKPQPAPASPSAATGEPLPDDEILGWAELLTTAVQLSNTTNYEDFRRDVPKVDQGRVLDCLDLDIRAKVRNLHDLWEKKCALAGVE